MNDWDTLQVLGDQLGWHFDAVFRTETGYVLVMVDTMGSEMEFTAPDLQAVVRKAVERLSSISESVLS